MDGSLLWVYEGLTQFWGYVLPVRAGLIPAAALPRDARRASRQTSTFSPGRAGARWPIPPSRRRCSTTRRRLAISRRDTDFYEASEFLWLNVDAELRARSAGKASLDDFMKRFYAGTGGEPAVKPYVESDVYAALAGVAPGDWRADHPHAPRQPRAPGAARRAGDHRLAAAYTTQKNATWSSSSSAAR